MPSGPPPPISNKRGSAMQSSINSNGNSGGPAVSGKRRIGPMGKDAINSINNRNGVMSSANFG